MQNTERYVCMCAHVWDKKEITTEGTLIEDSWVQKMGGIDYGTGEGKG